MKISIDKQFRERCCNLVLYSLFAVILSVLLILSASFTTHTALGVPNRYYPPQEAVNHPPVANVGPDQIVNESSKVMLVGAASDPDPNGKLTYSWMQTAGPAVTLNGINTATPTFTAPSNIPSDTQLKFALTAKDDKGAESNNPSIVTITVKHINRPPTANAGADQTGNKNQFHNTISLSRDLTDSISPDLAANNNNVYVAWTDRDRTTSDLKSSIRFTRSVTNGDKFENPVILSPTGQLPNGPKVASYSGNVYVVWLMQQEPIHALACPSVRYDAARYLEFKNNMTLFRPRR